MKTFINAIETLSEITGKMIAWLAISMVGVMFCVVVLRYAFNIGWISMQQSVTYLYAVFFLLGIAYTHKHNGHVRVDIFYQKFQPKTQATVDLIGAVVLLLPMCGFIFWTSLDYVALSWRSFEASNAAGGLPGVFLLKSFLLVMPLLLALQGLAQALKIFLWLKGDLLFLEPYQNAQHQAQPGASV